MNHPLQMCSVLSVLKFQIPKGGGTSHKHKHNKTRQNSSAIQQAISPIASNMKYIGEPTKTGSIRTNKTCPKCSDRKSRSSSNPGRTERTIEMRWGKQCMDDGSFQDIIIIPIHLAKMQVFAHLQPISDVIRLLDYCTFALL